MERMNEGLAWLEGELRYFTSYTQEGEFLILTLPSGDKLKIPESQTTKRGVFKTIYRYPEEVKDANNKI